MVAGKLDRVLPGGPDREWFRQRLGSLLGMESAPVSHDEDFAAWRRFLEHLSQECPAVLVSEDILWGDEATLAFLDHRAGKTYDAPLLVAGITRPEVFELAPGFMARASATPGARAPASRWKQGTDTPARARGSRRRVGDLPASLLGERRGRRLLAQRFRYVPTNQEAR